MKEKLRIFMAGRYGTDQLGRFTMGVGAVSLILYMFFHIRILYFVTLFCLIWYYYRALSRDHSRRYEENLKFLQLKNQALGKLGKTRRHMTDLKSYKFYTCPSCKQKIRVPRGHGKISITCPKCRTTFMGRS